jgi:hypothetical protein
VSYRRGEAERPGIVAQAAGGSDGPVNLTHPSVSWPGQAQAPSGRKGLGVDKCVFSPSDS